VLFNSSVFLLQFLPAVFAGFLILALTPLQWATRLWVTLASLAFYAWWRPENLPLLIGSMVFNYVLGGALIRKPSRALMIFGVAVNVALLAVFKYSAFTVETVNDVLRADLAAPDIVLPLAISFFTFQQIAYLVDANDGNVPEHGFLNYCLFITFFPHLIAGPITHHREMLPQFSDPDRFRPRWDLIAVGMTVFLVGLFKKVMLADPLGACASPIFAAAAAGDVKAIEAWTGALSYTLQIYFDFSGYTDMAIGLGLMFGIQLPPNFNSPFKARNIIDYWSRWHMTLTRFLTAYIYNPVVIALTRRRMEKGLPLPKRGRLTVGAFVTLVAFPTLLTMLISGVWHGAGWQFVVFGMLHGFYLVVAHGWRVWKKHKVLPLDNEARPVVAASVLLTFLCVVVALVFFRAPDVPTALTLLRGMAGANGVTLPNALMNLPGLAAAAPSLGVAFGELRLVAAWDLLRIGLLLAAVWALPNSTQWLRDYPTALGLASERGWLERFVPAARWRPSMPTGLAVGAVSVVTLLYALSAAPTEFLYFQF
jgi:alginate O-acetyltransferase complex protein AlgI